MMPGGNNGCGNVAVARCPNATFRSSITCRRAIRKTEPVSLDALSVRLPMRISSENSLTPSCMGELCQNAIFRLQTESGPKSAIDSGPLSMRKWSQQFLWPNECCDSPGNLAYVSHIVTRPLQRSRHRRASVNSIHASLIYPWRTRDDIEGSFTIA